MSDGILMKWVREHCGHSGSTKDSHCESCGLCPVTDILSAEHEELECPIFKNIEDRTYRYCYKCSLKNECDAVKEHEVDSKELRIELRQGDELLWGYGSYDPDEANYDFWFHLCSILPEKVPSTDKSTGDTAGMWNIIRGSLTDRLTRLFKDEKITMEAMNNINDCLVFYDERLKIVVSSEKTVDDNPFLCPVCLKPADGEHSSGCELAECIERFEKVKSITTLDTEHDGDEQ